MYNYEMMSHPRPQDLIDQINRTHNNLSISKIDRHYNRNTQKMVLLVSTKEMIENDVNAFIKGNKLVVEAFIQLDFNKPYRTHLPGSEFANNELGVSLIGFSEIRLKKGYQYTVASCRKINAMLIEVILSRKNLFFSSSKYEKQG